MSQSVELYTQVSSFEPLLPSTKREELAELTCHILREAGHLGGLLPAVIVRERISQLVREMNSYYSNLIEGHKTYPPDIEKALNENFSDQPLKRTNQHLARAHIQVEEVMIQHLEANTALDIHHPDFVCWLHREFYQRLPADLQTGQKMDSSNYQIAIGGFRDYEVRIAAHQPPHFGAVPDFMRRFGEFYGSRRILATNQLIALAAAHQRLAWIHPFGDGNGRVTRLHTHAWLHRCKVSAFGLWTISRALARQREEYYHRLNAADSTRLNDFDGRGNLSDQGLADFCVFFLKSMLDQIQFMSALLDLPNLTRRIEAHLHVAHANWSLPQREQVARLLKAALIEGTVDRGAVPLIIGRKVTSASAIIRLAIEAGLIDSTSPTKGSLSLVFDSNVLDSYFPKLFQDLPLA